MIVRRGKDTGFFKSKQIVVVLDLEEAGFLVEDMSQCNDGFWKDLVKGLREQIAAIEEI